MIASHRALLANHVPLRVGEIRYLIPGQVIFLLCMHDMENMRSAAGLPSSLVSYFVNNGLNKNTGLHSCMESIAEKVCSLWSHIACLCPLSVVSCRLFEIASLNLAARQPNRRFRTSSLRS